MIKICLMLGILIYYIGEGVTEGYTWASFDRRKKNKLVKLNHFSYGEGIYGYHVWRWIENFGVLMAMISIFYIDVSFDELMLTIVSTSVFSWLPYQMCFNHVTDDELIQEGSDYMIGYFVIPKPKWLFPAFGVVGTIGIIMSYFI